MNAVDTNVLIYARDPRDQRKRSIASDLVANLADGALLWQVACESLAAGRKLTAIGQPANLAFEDLASLRRIWKLLLPGWLNVDRARELMMASSISVWDALLVAACLEGEVNTLYSEDIVPHPAYRDLQIVNPFA
jgi:predicted nucleic acid-binding protein